MYKISLHAQERRIERDLREDDLAAAMCAKPVLHLADKTAHYFDPASGVVVVCLVLPVRVVKTMMVAGSE